jgi:hypothetical protein
MIPQDKFNDDRLIFLISTFLAVYFVFLFLNAHYLYIRFDALELAQEMTTLPFLFLNCFLFVYLFYQSISYRDLAKPYLRISLIVTFISNALTWGSIIKTAYANITSTSIAGLFLSILPVLFLAFAGLILIRLFFKRYVNSH